MPKNDDALLEDDGADGSAEEVEEYEEEDEENLTITDEEVDMGDDGVAPDELKEYERPIEVHVDMSRESFTAVLAVSAAAYALALGLALYQLSEYVEPGFFVLWSAEMP
ncbi:hypothetical protein FACS1894139_10060 [Planctomycetales bacterium]|nr:hypothetical protein FACS1894107_01640 [Planctomycetales bacterium]GHS97249.1 hypothetical protein FACS1894108_03310 [Planctomycetales bacterium]GHT05722.1 hypothetical protein FACS1894139_10060 [Planctomycetales bacterium]GHV21117.1 hypothetical protein AGMMS49959_09700 [Planctomycetales bacterium]